MQDSVQLQNFPISFWTFSLSSSNISLSFNYCQTSLKGTKGKGLHWGAICHFHQYSYNHTTPRAVNESLSAKSLKTEWLKLENITNAHALCIFQINREDQIQEPMAHILALPETFTSTLDRSGKLAFYSKFCIPLKDFVELPSLMRRFAYERPTWKAYSGLV